MQVEFFFAGWRPLVRIVVGGVVMYAALVLFLRVSGSRTLAKMNAFDFVVTVAIGAAFGGSLTSRSVAFAEAVTAFGVLVSLQYLVGWLQVRWPLFRRAVTNPPTLLYYRGEYRRGEMQRQRVTEADLHALVRGRKTGSMRDVEAVVLETSGEFSVVTSVDDGSAMDDVGASAGEHGLEDES